MPQIGMSTAVILGKSAAGGRLDQADRAIARQGEAVDSATCHLGFRCIVRAS